MHEAVGLSGDEIERGGGAGAKGTFSPGLHSTFGSLSLFLLQAHWELISVETTASGFCSEYTISQ